MSNHMHAEGSDTALVITRISRALARIELRVAAVLLALVFGLLLLNIVTRLAGHALFWVDEAAVMGMVWMTFLAASVSLQRRTNIAVTLAVDLFGECTRRWLGVLVDVLLLVFVVILLVLVWRWFAPLELIAAGGDLVAFSTTTFNFMYEEPTQTLGLRKAWFWAILPVFAVCASIHCVANLADGVRNALRGGN